MTSFAERRRALRAVNRLNSSLNIALPTAERMTEFRGFDMVAPVQPAPKTKRKRKP